MSECMTSLLSYFCVVFHSLFFCLISVVLNICISLTLEELYDTVSDLFCLHPINDGVHSWRKKKIKISHNNVKRRGNGVSSKTMGKESEECWNISDDDGRYMGSASAEGLLLSICCGEADHCPKNHGVGDRNSQDVKASSQEGNHQTIDGI